MRLSRDEFSNAVRDTHLDRVRFSRHLRDHDKDQRKELEGERRAGDVHRDINRAVSRALGQEDGASWYDLGEKVEALCKKLEFWKEEGLNAIHSVEMVLDERDTYRAALESIAKETGTPYARIAKEALEAK